MFHYTEFESCLFYKTLNISKLIINDLDHFHNYGHNYVTVLRTEMTPTWLCVVIVEGFQESPRVVWMRRGGVWEKTSRFPNVLNSNEEMMYYAFPMLCNFCLFVIMDRYYYYSFTIFFNKYILDAIWDNLFSSNHKEPTRLDTPVLAGSTIEICQEPKIYTH